MPRSGYSSLKSQMVRSSESVAFNIVEGCGAVSQKEFARFLEMSIKSSSELESQLELAKDYGALGSRQWMTLSAEVVEIRKMTCGLRRRVREAEQPPRRPRSDGSRKSRDSRQTGSTDKLDETA